MLTNLSKFLIQKLIPNKENVNYPFGNKTENHPKHKFIGKIFIEPNKLKVLSWALQFSQTFSLPYKRSKRKSFRSNIHRIAEIKKKLEFKPMF